ncbi:MAG TPA: hypothetical protein DCP91_11725 [Eggerthellaceae bacterium]|nr:hypothetical protein [Eggerthellaceae bacterium]
MQVVPQHGRLVFAVELAYAFVFCRGRFPDDTRYLVSHAGYGTPDVPHHRASHQMGIETCLAARAARSEPPQLLLFSDRPEAGPERGVRAILQAQTLIKF